MAEVWNESHCDITGEILSLESSSTGEILFSVEDVQTWLLNSEAIFHVTPHREWFTEYS